MNYVERELAQDDLTFLASAYQVIGAWVLHPDKDENYLIREKERMRQARGHKTEPKYCQQCGVDITGRNANAKYCRPCSYNVDLMNKRMQARKEAARGRV